MALEISQALRSRNLTGEMFGSGTYNVGLGFTNGNDKLFNGYLNSMDPATSPTGTPTQSLLTPFGTLPVLRPPIGSTKVTSRPS